MSREERNRAATRERERETRPYEIGVHGFGCVVSWCEHGLNAIQVHFLSNGSKADVAFLFFY